MAMKTMTDVLRAAMRSSGIPLIELQRRTGIDRAGLRRFRDGKTSIYLSGADKLAETLGLKLRHSARRRN